MNIKKVRRWFLILVVSSCSAAVFLILSGYRFPHLHDHALPLGWKNGPSQQEVRGVKTQARYRIPGQTGEPVDSIHLTKNKNIGIHESKYDKKDAFYHSESFVSNLFSTKSLVKSLNVSKESGIAQEQTEDETKQQHHHPGNSSTLTSSLLSRTFKRKVKVHHRQFQLSKGFRNQPDGRHIGVNKDEHIGHFASRNTSHRKMFSMKEDVVMELMPKYTNMPPVSQTEFLQLKADGILRRNISRELFNLAPEVFLKTPLTFSRQTKGQCWFVNDVSAPPNQRMRCLPYFYVMGMPKCGTTDLYAKIVRHPSAVNLLKEPHWWARHRVGRGIEGEKRRVSYDDYLHHFSDVDAVFTNRKPKIFVGGDGSASTMWYLLQYIDVKDKPDYPALPEVIREIQPEVKLIAMLREPVERLYSDYMYFHRKMVNASDLHNLVESSISNFTSCTKLHSPRYCVGKRVRAQEARVTVGLYSVFLVDWLKVFPRDRILILRLRDWNADCLTLLPKVYAFLEIETLPDTAIKRMCNSSAQNVNSKTKFPMLNATVEILSDFYRPYNEDLAALLHDDRFLWLD